MHTSYREQPATPIQLQAANPGRTAGSAGLFLHTANVLAANPTVDEIRIWSGWLRATRVIDDVLDDQGGDPGVLVTQLQNGVAFGTLTDETAQACKDFFERHTAEERSQIEERFFWLQEATQAYRNTTSLRELTALRLNEATGYFANFFKLPPRGNNDKPRERFNDWVVGFSRSGYLVDSVLDFKEDFENGEIQVRPSRSNTAILCVSAIAETYKAIRVTPRRALTGAAKVAIRHSRI
jgi:hypothetical protein